MTPERLAELRAKSRAFKLTDAERDELKAYGARTFGADIDRTKLAVARDEAGQRGASNVEFHEMDFRTAAGAADFDVVYARFLLTHLSDPADAVATFFRHVRPGGLVAVQRFLLLMADLDAKPKSHIYYKREAYVADNDEVRVTMDRDVFSEPNLTSNIKVKMTNAVHSYEGFVILELKFTNRFPNWFRELVRMANAIDVTHLDHVTVN